jgi:hypothetical protein
MIIKKHLALLGYEAKDKVSDFKGIVVSICFDLYGCIQADVRPRELKNDGALQSGFWLDVNRLDIISEKPLMLPPNFEWGEIAEGKKGPARLPTKTDLPSR